MYEFLDEMRRCIETSPIALARVVSTSGAGPRSVGASMVVTEDGRPLGSLSAGCVESVVINTALDVIRTGRATHEHFGYSDSDALGVGLTCGGEVEVFIERFDESDRAFLDRLIAGRDEQQQVSALTVLDGDARRGRGATIGCRRSAVAEAESRYGLTVASLVDQGSSGAVETQGVRTFVHTFLPPPRMLLAGANDFVGALGALAGLLGYRVTVVDARPLFATTERFPTVHEVVVDWPHRYLRAEFAAGRVDKRTVVCVMTHDSKFDVPMLEAALEIDDLAFVGALGSRLAHRDRLERLRAAGQSEQAITRVHSPLGLDLDARSPEETAVSILAHVIADRSGASGQRLRDLQGPIHRHQVSVV